MSTQQLRCSSVHPIHGRCLRSDDHPFSDDKDAHEAEPSRDREIRTTVERGIDGELSVRWPRQWMVRELVDDHRAGGTRETQKIRTAIGLLLVPGALPRLVACGDPAHVAGLAKRGEQPTYCCNEVYRDMSDGSEHLSTWSTLTVSGAQLADLHLYGEIGGSAMAYSSCHVVLLDEEKP